MKTLIVTALLLFVPNFANQSVSMGFCLLNRPKLVMAQEGNPGHKEPPPGWVCAHGTGNDKEMPCKCHRECKDMEELDEFGEGTGKRVTYVKEDPQCNSFCFKDHCLCGADNCD